MALLRCEAYGGAAPGRVTPARRRTLAQERVGKRYFACSTLRTPRKAR